MMKKEIKVFMATLFLLASFGCGNKTRLKVDPNAQALAVVSGVGFKEVFEKVLKNDCLECHTTYDNYQLVSTPIARKRILNAVLGGRMPKSRPSLSSEQKSTLQTWVNNGAPEFADKVSKSIPLAPTYTSLFVNVLGPKCVACHTGSVNSPAPPGVNFTNYETLIESNDDYALVFGEGFMSQDSGADSELIYLVKATKEPMPPLKLPGNDAYNKNPIPKLTLQEIEALTEWIKKGFPND